MTIKCVAIDDEPLALKVITQYLTNFPALKLIHAFDDAIAGAEFLRKNQIDLLFIDINMPDISGLELIRSLEEKPMIIFTTAHKKFALEGFELNAVDYILKPIEFERFAIAVNKAIDYFHYKTAKAKAGDVLFVRSEYQLVKIELNDIEYIESVEDYVKIHFATGRPILSLMTLKSMLEKLPADRFKRIHRSYIIPIAKIKSVGNKKVKLTTIELPVSNSYTDVVNKLLKK